MPAEDNFNIIAFNPTNSPTYASLHVVRGITTNDNTSNLLIQQNNSPTHAMFTILLHVVGGMTKKR